jgi:hypothetical protein
MFLRSKKYNFIWINFKAFWLIEYLIKNYFKYLGTIENKFVIVLKISEIT